MKLAFFLALFMQFTMDLLIAQNHLELTEIMAGNEYIGPQPSDVHWSPNNEEFYFQWDHDNNNHSSYFVYSLKSKKYKQLTDKESHALPINGYFKSENGQHIYFKNTQGVLYKWSNENSHAVFSFHNSYKVEKVFDSGEVLVRIENEFYHIKPSKFSFTRQFGFKQEDESESSSFLSNQQKELFTHFQDEQPEEQETPWLEIDKGKGNTINWVSTSEQHHYILFESSQYPTNKETNYMSYVTGNGYAQSKKARSKVGKENPEHWLYLYQAKNDTSLIVDISKLSGITNKPNYHKIYDSNASLSYEGPKTVVYHTHGMNSNKDHFLVEIKSYDNKDRWIVLIDTTGQLVEIDHQHDEAWIGGPGISGWNSVSGNCGWIDNTHLYFQSEESGFSHLYTYNIQSQTKKQLTSGKYEIHKAILSSKKDKFFITANKNHPGNRSFYTLNLKDGKFIPILTNDGCYEVIPSPNEKYLAIRFSFSNQPWELYTALLKENTTPNQITHSTTDQFKSYQWRVPKVITFEAADGEQIHARLYKASEETKNGAGIIFVHGAGYLQNAHHWWSGYYREYMFNNLLADKGYTVLDIDYRASKGYGRQFRTAIYRHMGGKDLSDQLDGRKYLIEEHGIDSNRIGIYGGSYGGFITLMALLKEPGKFKCGAALRSVTDWAHYNHPYTSNILNTPETDPEAFRQSSPIYFAENLSDHLIMLHGIEDDNVQYQDVIRLSQRFIELKKQNWALIGYPVEAHGFKETSSWIDEYRRILKLFEQHLRVE